MSKFLIIKSDIDCSIIDCFSNRILILSFVLLFDIKNCKNLAHDKTIVILDDTVKDKNLVKEQKVGDRFFTPREKLDKAKKIRV